VFAEDPSRVALVACRLDGDELAPAAQDEDGATFELGAAAELPGRTLELVVRVEGAKRSLSWTFVGE
jgi:hypothetical protein